MMNSTIRISNLIFMLEMKELLHLIACTFSGTDLYFVGSRLKALGISSQEVDLGRNWRTGYKLN